MERKETHEEYHSGLKYQKRVINENDFTYRHIISALKPYIKSKISILDIGSGSGALAYYLASKDTNVVGVDISQKAASMANHNAKFLQLDKHVKFICADFPRESVNGKFDLILLTEVLEHLQNDNLAINVVYGLLKKEGIALITVPSKSAPLYRIGLLDQFDKRVGHLRRYSEIELAKLFNEKHFSVVSLTSNEGFLRNLFYTNRFFGFFVKFLKGIFSDIVTTCDVFLASLLGTSQIILVVSKK